MSFIRETLADDAKEFHAEFLDRMDALADWSGQTRNLLRNRPGALRWLHANHLHPLTLQELEEIWEKDFSMSSPVEGAPCAIADRLRHFRSWMSLRCAFREAHALVPVEKSLNELTLLADFCLSKLYDATLADLQARHGTPQDNEAGKRARCCILGMGKLGGGELNFWSDVDLVFLYEGDGHCQKDGRPQSLSCREFFTRFVRAFNTACQERTREGVLYNVDLRLRPEGETGPLIKNLQSTVNYYYTAGQTWERLALARMRVIAGDASLGGEFQEEVHSFAHPVHPPPSLLQELAATRVRFGGDQQDPANIENIKTGQGGIREVEFFVQGHQLLQAGSQPFLQARSTLDSLTRLAQYHIIPEARGLELREAYLFLRLVENRLQIQEEQPVHKLPATQEGQDALARTLGLANWKAFKRRLDSHREKVHLAYQSLFGNPARDDDSEDWFSFFAGSPASGAPAHRLQEWFGEREDTEEHLRLFVLGSHANFLTQEHVRLFLSLAEHFPNVLPQLAFPMRTLRRLGRFAEHYGTRKGLFKTCALTPHLFAMLCLLFDRSPFIHDLLCRHPELLDELLTQPVRLLKDAGKTLQEIGNLPATEEFPRCLWLYVQAEQIRASTGEHLGYFDTPVIEKNLSLLADCVLQHLLDKEGLCGQLGIVALGKYGAEELTIGSDLDLLLLTADTPSPSLQQAAKRLLQTLSWKTAQGPTYEVDTRLRPYGVDGPLVISLNRLGKYHAGTAKLWERQCLTRARFIAGPPKLGQQFATLREQILFGQEFGSAQVAEMFAMRERIHLEKEEDAEEGMAFKTCRGGLGEIEFFVQALQIHHGQQHSGLRPLTHTRDLFRLLPKFKCIDKQGCARLLLNYNYLRKLEFFLRRFHGRPTTTLSGQPVELSLAAKCFQVPSHQAFLDEHRRRIEQSRNQIKLTLATTFGLDIR